MSKIFSVIALTPHLVVKSSTRLLTPLHPRLSTWVPCSIISRTTRYHNQITPSTSIRTRQAAQEVRIQPIIDPPIISGTRCSSWVKVSNSKN